MMTKEQRWQKAMDFWAPTCHQKSDRSFFYHGWQFPICARCTGLYLGYLLGIVMLFVAWILPFWMCVLLIALMFFDWILQFKKIKQSNNVRRCMTGLGAGIAIIQVFGYGVRLIATIWS